MLCVCHGAEMGWQKDARMAAGGRWECREKRREYNRRRHAQKVAWLVADYRKSPRQYAYKRGRDLRKQRDLIVQRLAQLNQEAEDLGAEPGHTQ